jgi:hypothetical protein
MNLTGLRVAVGIVLALAWSVVAYWAMPFVFYPAPALGWLYASLVFALGLGIAGLLIGGRDSVVPLGVAAVLSLSLGVVCWQNMEPDLDRVRAVADRIAVPDGWEQASGFGNESGLFEGGATHVSRTYRTGTETHTAATSDLVASMEDQGWSVEESSGDPEDRTVVLTSGGWEAQITRGGRGSGITLTVERVS